MLSKIFGEADSFDVWVCGGEAFDDVPDVVWATVIYEDDFVVGARARCYGFANFVYHRFDGALAAVAGDDK